MTIVSKIIISNAVPKQCILCDFCVTGTALDKKLGSKWICTAGKVGRPGKETLDAHNVYIMCPDWCPLELEEGED
jgi:hypothetical protein